LICFVQKIFCEQNLFNFSDLKKLNAATLQRSAAFILFKNGFFQKMILVSATKTKHSSPAMNIIEAAEEAESETEDSLLRTELQPISTSQLP